MTALIVILSIAAVVVAIGFIRVGLHARYDEDGLFAAAKMACFKIQLAPAPEKKKKTKPLKEKKPKEEKPKPEGEKTEKKSAKYYLDIFGGVRAVIDLALELLGDLLDCIKTDLLDVTFVSAKKDDPADAASIYGTACAVGGIISPFLENNKNVKEYSIKLDVDFAAERPKFAGEVKVSFSIGRIVRFAFRWGARLISIYLKNKPKGGAKDGKTGNEYA